MSFCIAARESMRTSYASACSDAHVRMSVRASVSVSTHVCALCMRRLIVLCVCVRMCVFASLGVAQVQRLISRPLAK